MPRHLSLRFAFLILATIVLALRPSTAGAQSEQAPTFSQEELDQIVAPIALYPDSVLSQVFMASTYPLEIVEADRWVKKNPNLTGEALAKALEEQSWDASVKSLINVPDVLDMMSEKLDWTTKLGDAFVSQQDGVMEAVQRLRARAKESGNLKSNEQIKVEVQQQPSEPQTIVIQQANPQVIYVPVYNPTVVYGAWPYPAYPPYYYYPPAYTPRPGLWFGAGFACGAAWGYAWGNCNWGYHGNNSVKINVNQNINYNRNIKVNSDYKKNVNVNGGNWQHNAEHRKGVAYRDSATAQKYNRGANSDVARARESYRGREAQGNQFGSGNARTNQAGTNRAGTNQARTNQAGANANRTGDKAGAANRTGASPNKAGNRAGNTANSRSGNNGAFTGANQGAQKTRDASARGSQSRGRSAKPAARPSSSGSRSRSGGGSGARRR